MEEVEASRARWISAEFRRLKRGARSRGNAPAALEIGSSMPYSGN